MIDIDYDFRTDAKGRDPDKHSATLRNYHRSLWSKTLPNGKKFILKDAWNEYLSYNAGDKEHFFSSDSVIHTYSNENSGWRKYMGEIIDKIPRYEIEEFHHLGYTIGAMMIFPRKRVGNKSTINGARGMNCKIADRFDLTLECIRLFYNEKESPLTDVLSRYRWFFELFTDFKGYADFFLLQDMVESDYSGILFFHPFNGFEPWPLPKTVDEYMRYKERSTSFIKKRNLRIKRWADENQKDRSIESYGV